MSDSLTNLLTEVHGDFKGRELASLFLAGRLPVVQASCVLLSLSDEVVWSAISNKTQVTWKDGDKWLCQLVNLESV